MELCNNGTLEELSKMKLSEGQIKNYSYQILQAIFVLHDHKIVHRDVKGANIFLMPNNSIKLGDFGCSVRLKYANTTMGGELMGLIGTPAFMAPEVITGSRGYGKGADIWSFGCVIIQMATGERPWHNLENKVQIMYKVGSGAIPRIPDSLSQEGFEFVQHCLEPDDTKRWTASQLLTHPFVKWSQRKTLKCDDDGVSSLRK
ncbi:hypothetical protein HELRODRAFT_111085 [Helobdella robusta]|uniref:Protein kinase domain-containing protein n=1 Tax=Helobdella robusta TaxID=6412 RepID=T1EF79_HELRO|nr:hypothetical protein HELRODRAFT_111085 [Helobdella robusta]ESO05545.1 hypothetical protein HELRODRAFT_111085 [Helobdella robusta]